MSALPMKSLDEFKKVGGALTGGSQTSHESYEGPPRPYNEKLSTTFEKLEEKFHHPTHTTSGTTTTGTTGMTKTHHTTDSGIGGVGHDHTSHDIGHTGNTTGMNNKSLGHHNDGVPGTTGGVKPSFGGQDESSRGC